MGWGCVPAVARGDRLIPQKDRCLVACYARAQEQVLGQCLMCLTAMMHPACRLVDENGQPMGPFRVWLQYAWIPGLAMSRALGDVLAHQ